MKDDRYLGAIYHHGIKGMKWGVRRSPEQLGHAPKKVLAKLANRATIEDGFYRSPKGFVIHQDKLTKFCLLPGGKHATQFFKIGYSEDDPDRLFCDIENGYAPECKIDRRSIGDGHEKACIPMTLGVTAKRLFRTVWQDDGPDGSDRFISAYIDRRLKED